VLIVQHQEQLVGHRAVLGELHVVIVERHRLRHQPALRAKLRLEPLLELHDRVGETRRHFLEVQRHAA